MTSAAHLYGTMLSGAFLTETIFSWPGLGLYTYNAIMNLDYAAILGTTVLITSIFIVINLITDLLYAFIDPRVKYR
jgi:peptide/nickel transport system permease protein